MSDARPKLAVVPGGEIDTAEPSLPVPADASRVRSVPRSWPWLLALVMVVAALAFESHRAESLAGRVAGLEVRVVELEAELAGAEAALGGYRTHLDDVRAAVTALDELVAREPAQR